MEKINRSGLLCAYHIGKILYDMKLALQRKERYNVRGDNGLIAGLSFIKEDLKILNICPNVQTDIEGQISYLFMLYIKPLNPSLYLVDDDRKIFKEHIEEWTDNIYNSLKTDFYEPLKIRSAPTIFIGHGHNVWKELEEHLTKKQHFKVETYESEERAGYMIPKNVEDMITKSSIAFLVFTGEIEDKDGKFHARDNVIHELGLCQNHLCLNRAIILMEEGISEPSNIHGVQQVRFHKDFIREIFGDVVAIVRREFSPLAYNNNYNLSR